MKHLLILVVVAATVVGDDLPPSCERPVYCNSSLLHHVQMARIFNDSKTFVDLPLRNDEITTLSAFQALLNNTNDKPTKEELRAFVEENFDEESVGELEKWTPPDYQEHPEFLDRIRDANLREFAKDINKIWPTLGRKVRPEVDEKPDQFSLVPVPNGFIIPGGRFKELYYWDAYWIIEGLIISGMRDTARGMIENLIALLKKFGKIPNGSRWYYQERSQPPLLTAMIKLYYEKTKDKAFLAKHIDSVDKEMNYWLDTQSIKFSKDNKEYTLLRYYAPSAGPRPESYYEDYEDAQMMDTNENHEQFYTDIKSAAESGWDFSSRWFISPQGDNNGTLTDIRTRDIIPVDLNAIFAEALANTAKFYCILKSPLKAAFWGLKAEQWKINIEKVLWNEEDGIWYDYDMQNEKHRRYFYPSNVSPLWREVVQIHSLMDHAPKVLNYLKKSQGLDFPGGIPVSLVRSGQQWDFPNVWPPEVSIVIKGLENTKTREGKELAFELAQDWVRICYKSFNESKQMFEKYDAENPGQFGGGGEYNVQAGFGWSNGVVLEFLERYGDKMKAYESYNEDELESETPQEKAADNKASYLDHLGVVPLILGGNYMARS